MWWIGTPSVYEVGLVMQQKKTKTNPKRKTRFLFHCIVQLGNTNYSFNFRTCIIVQNFNWRRYWSYLRIVVAIKSDTNWFLAAWIRERFAKISWNVFLAAFQGLLSLLYYVWGTLCIVLWKSKYKVEIIHVFTQSWDTLL